MREQKRKRAFPLPEALAGERGGPWEVEELDTPRVDVKKRKMDVPLGTSDGERASRAHEMAHAQWSPEDVPEIEGVRAMTLQVVEDARMNCMLTGARVKDLYKMEKTEKKVMRQVLKDALYPPVNLAHYAIASAGAPRGEEMRKLVRSVARQVEDKEDRARYLEAVRIGERVGKTFQRVYDAREKLTFDDTVVIAKQVQEMLDVLEKRETLPVPGEEMDIRTDLDKLPWGEMTVAKVALPIRMSGRWRRQIKRVSDEGVVPMRWDRLAVDQKIFRRVIYKKKERPTILVDHSGSMHFSAEQIVCILEAFPFARVAVYSGEERKGELKVLADNGKRAREEDCERYGGGNVVDGPALQWLAQQTAPRIWISDEGVTGVGDIQRHGMVTECRRIAALGNIKRAYTLGDALHLLQRAKKERK